MAAAYDIYAANHPGTQDPANPGFPAQLARARDRGLDAARRATDRAGYVAALGAFSTELSDGHALLFAKAAEGPAMAQQWAGFIPAWRGGRLIVQQAAPGAPVSVGEVIRACDGLPAADFIRQRLAALNFRPAEAGQWWFHAPGPSRSRNS